MDLESLSEAWWGFGALGHNPGPQWVQAFAAALQAALAAGGSGGAPGRGARAACRIVISSARAGRNGVPGGRPMLEALVQRVLGQPTLLHNGAAAVAAAAAGSLARELDSPPAGTSGSAGQLTGSSSVTGSSSSSSSGSSSAGASPSPTSVGGKMLLRPRPSTGVAVAAAGGPGSSWVGFDEASGSRERAVEAAESLPQERHNGLLELDAPQVLLLMEALLLLGYQGAETLLGRFAAGAKLQRTA